MKEKKYRRSLRQAEILMQLDEKPAKTITELAERMDAQRPSISRSLRLLKEQEVVFRDRKGWHLTESGRDEASSVRDELIKFSEKMKNITLRTSEIFGRMDGLADITKNIGESLTPSLGLGTGKMFNEVIKNIGESFTPSPGLGTGEMFNEVIKNIGESLTPSLGLGTGKMFNEVIKNIGESFTPSLGLGTGKMFNEVIRPLIEAQERNSTLLSNFTVPTYLTGIDRVAKQNHLHLANAIDNILTIRQTNMAQIAAQASSSIDFSLLSSHLIDVNQSFGQVFQRNFEKLGVLDSSTIPSSLIEGLFLPTATTAHYSHSLRDLVEAETETDIPPLPNQGVEEVGDQTLDALLYDLNPDFVEMRLGSWSVLQISGPDRLRQAATSQRELLRQLLQFLVPNIQLPEDQRQGPQIKARVRKALEISKSDAEFIEAVVQAVYSYYNQLNKYTHHNKKHEESLIALLRTGEGLIRFILAKIGEKFN